MLLSVLSVAPHLRAQSPPSYTLSLNECVQWALENNDQVKAAAQDQVIFQGKWDEAHPKHIPIIQYHHRIAPVPRDADNAAESFFNGDISVFNNFKVEVGMPVTSFGKLKTAQELADIGIQASWFQGKQKEDEIVYTIHQIYHGILLVNDLLRLAGEGESAIQNKITEMANAQLQDQVGILKLKMGLFEIQRKIEDGKKRREVAYSALKLQMGLEDDVRLNLKSSGLTPVPWGGKSYEFFLDRAKTYLPEFRLLEAGVSAKEKQLTLEKLKPAPNLGFGGFFDIGRAPGIRGAEDESSFTNPFNFTKAGVGFQLQGDLDFSRTAAKRKQAKADLLKTIYQKRAAVRALEVDLKKAYLEVVVTKSLMDKAVEEKKVGRQLVFLAKSNLDIGLGEQKDYLEALQAYFLFQSREFEAIYNFNVAVANLSRKAGDLYTSQKKE